MDRIQRLFRLAKKTGDTLIVHDPSGHDMVVMDVHRYEDLVDESMYGHDFEPLHEMNEREMLDKINRDIAIWRSHQEELEQATRAAVLEEKLRHEPPFDPFAEDFAHKDDWFTAGDVLQERHHDMFRHHDPFAYEPIISPDAYEFDDEDDDDDMLWDEEDNDEFDIPPEFFSPKKVYEEPDISYDEIGEQQFPTPTDKRDIPFVPYEEIELRDDEHLADDGPVFFEEPV